jgi:hypothetical protein
MSDSTPPKSPQQPQQPAAQDLEASGIIRSQKAHQVTIEQGSKNAAGKRAEIGEAPVKKINTKVEKVEEAALASERLVEVKEGQSLPPKRAEGLDEALASPEARLANAEEGVAIDRREKAAELEGSVEHREKAAESAGILDHRESAAETPGAGDHRELASEAPGAGANRVPIDTPPIQDLDENGVPRAGVAKSNFQAAPGAIETTGRVLAPEVEGQKPRDWSLAGSHSEESPQEEPAEADMEEEIDAAEVLADLNALAEGVEEPPAEFYEQMDFPARVVHLHIENEKVQAQIKELEKPWERV